jgi:hypothetical protein
LLHGSSGLSTSGEEADQVDGGPSTFSGVIGVFEFYGVNLKSIKGRGKS